MRLQNHNLYQHTSSATKIQFNGLYSRLFKKKKSEAPLTSLNLFENNPQTKEKVQEYSSEKYNKSPLQNLYTSIMGIPVCAAFALASVGFFFGATFCNDKLENAKQEATIAEKSSFSIKSVALALGVLGAGVLGILSGIVGLMGFMDLKDLIVNLPLLREARKKASLFITPVEPSDTFNQEYRASLKNKIKEQAQNLAKLIQPILHQHPEVEPKKFFKDILDGRQQVDPDKLIELFEGKAALSIIQSRSYFNNLNETPMGEIDFLHQVLQEFESARLIMESPRIAESDAAKLSNVEFQKSESFSKLLDKIRMIHNEKEEYFVDDVTPEDLKQFQKLSQEQYKQLYQLNQSLKSEFQRLEQCLDKLKQFSIPFLLTQQTLQDKLETQRAKVAKLEAEFNESTALSQASPILLLEQKRLYLLEEKYNRAKQKTDETLLLNQQVLTLANKTKQLIVDSLNSTDPTSLQTKSMDMDLGLKLAINLQELEGLFQKMIPLAAEPTDEKSFQVPEIMESQSINAYEQKLTPPSRKRVKA